MGIVGNIFIGFMLLINLVTIILEIIVITSKVKKNNKNKYNNDKIEIRKDMPIVRKTNFIIVIIKGLMKKFNSCLNVKRESF